MPVSFSSHSFSHSAFLTLFASSDTSLMLEQFLICNSFLISSRFLFWPFASKLKSSFFEMASPRAMHILWRTIHANVVMRTLSWLLSLFRSRTICTSLLVSFACSFVNHRDTQSQMNLNTSTRHKQRTWWQTLKILIIMVTRQMSTVAKIKWCHLGKEVCGFSDPHKTLLFLRMLLLLIASYCCC